MTNNRISKTGVFIFGGTYAIWPCVTLVATSDTLRLNSIMLGNYSFSPDQVIAIEVYKKGFLSIGIKIHHNVPTYPQHIVFSCFGPLTKLIERIKETGFVPSAKSENV